MEKNKDIKQKPDTAAALDLSDFVIEVDLFSRLIEPFALVFYAIDDIRRWRFRRGTILVWLVCNAACIWLSQGAVFVLVSSLVIGIATLSLFQIHTQILNKVLPSRTQPQKTVNEEEESGALDTVQHFRYSLIAMHDFVVKSNEYLNYFYSILRWDAAIPSAIYHVEVCVFLLSLVVGPARWNCFLFINWFFLCHPHIIRRSFRYFHEQWSKIKQPSTLKEKVSDVLEEKDKDNFENLSTDDDYDEDSSDLDMTEKVSDSSMISLEPSPTKPGMVARLMEIKKRRKQLASAPAALKETVLVCCSCHALLVNQGDITMEGSDRLGPG